MTKLHLQNYPMSFSFLAMWAKSSLILRRQRSALSQRGSKRPRTSENQAKPNVAHLELVKFSSSQQGPATSQMGKRFYMTNLTLLSSCLIFDCKSSNTFDGPYAHNLLITFYTTYCNHIKGFNIILKQAGLIFDCKSSNTFDGPYAHNLLITFYTTYCNHIKGFNKILKQADRFSRLTDSIQKKNSKCLLLVTLWKEKSSYLLWAK